MRKGLLRILLFAFLLVFLPAHAMGEGGSPRAPSPRGTATGPTRFYVAPDGNDGWSGKLPEPSVAKMDGPFATLERARDEIRTLKHSGGVSKGGALVIVRGGVYLLDKPFELTEADSGAATAPVCYAAFPGEVVRLVGGKIIRKFQPVTDTAILDQLDEAARGHVVQADLKALGITDFGPVPAGGLEVFFQDNAMTVARWPNEGFVRIADIVEQDGHKIHGISGSKVGKFVYEGDRPKRWMHEKDAWVHGYWFWDWSDQRQKIESIDPGKHILSIVPPYHTYGYRKGQWFYAFNLLSELDAPGEWYLDRDTGILYFWPPASPDGGKTLVSVLPSLVTIKDASFVSLRGFLFEGARGTAVTVSGGHDTEIADCTIRNVGGWGVQVSGANHVVTGCDIYQTGCGGIAMNGGDRKTLTPAGLCAENNRIHHYGRVNRMYQPGIQITGVGNRAAHNRIHSAPHMAIQFSGNDHLIEFNEIDHVCFESNDAGAIYAGRDWTMRGNTIRHNYLHHITGFEDRGCVGVYLDDMFASAAIYGNVFYKVTRAAFLGGGRDCTVENNIFVDCEPALHVDARALGWAGYHADDWIKEAHEKGTILGIAYKEPPYSMRFPQLVHILEDEPKAPKGNLIARNLCWRGKWDDIEDKARSYLALEDNLIDVDPQFVDPERLDFHLKDTSPAWKIGFKAIPIDEIGPYCANAVRESLSWNLYRRLAALPETPPAVRPAAYAYIAKQARLMHDEKTAETELKRALKAAKRDRQGQFKILWDAACDSMASTQWVAARVGFEKVLKMKDVPSEFSTFARLRVAESFARGKDYAAARSEYAKVQSQADLPPHLRSEALERLSELDRLEAGLPSRDPASSRAQFPPRPEPAVKLYVAPSGSDANPGTIEQPFATPQRALDEITAIKSRGLAPGGVTVYVREGEYPLRAGLRFTAAASGTAEAPIVFRAYESERARLYGGIRLSGFRPVEDPAVQARFCEEARAKVMQLDLKAHGVTDFGRLESRGFGCASTPIAELYFNGRPMQRARWPNEGFVRTGNTLEPGSMKENRGAIFEYDGDRPARWSQARDIWLYGYWYYDWADNAIDVESIDPRTRQIRTRHTSPYGVQKGQPYYVFNLLEEIDQPGEWYLDRETGILYFYPPSDLKESVVELSMLNEPMVQVEGASCVSFECLTFECGRGDGIVINGGEHCLVAGCTLRAFGSTGVIVKGGANDGIFGCDISTLGRGGTVIIGGDRATLAPGGHFVENCHIHDFSRVDRTYTPAVQIEGVGNRIAHNEFHDSPCHAIRLEGNDHVVEFNNIYNVVRESDDQGGLDMFGNPAYRGNVLRYNYWHDIGSGRACGQAGIRLDDAISGTVIYGNVFYRCSEANFGGVQIHGGKDNWVDNNLFVDCKYALSFSPWGRDRWEKFLASDSVKGLIQAVNAAAPPYSTHYPDLARLTEAPDVNRVWRNLVYNCGQFLARDQGKQNLIDNWVTNEDPGFADTAKGNFRLKDTASICEKIGFRPIPFEEIGPYEHPLRASWPIAGGKDEKAKSR